MPDDLSGEPASSIASQVAAYMQRYNLRLPQMAEHAGVSRNTLKPILSGDRQPREAARLALVEAIAKPPPKKPDPPHADVVRQYWGCESSEAIGRRVNVSGSRVRAIAKAIGLTGGDTVQKRDRDPQPKGQESDHAGGSFA